MYNIGFSLQPQYNLSITQVITLLKDAGFSAVSPVWSPESDFSSIANCVRENGMTIQSLHAPHAGIASLWEPDSEYSSGIHKNILRSIDICAQFQIPILVLHGWQGLIYTFPKDPLNFRHFDSFVQYAQNRHVSVAFENLEGEEYLDALMMRYRDLSHVGFCWDSGHDHCYPHQTDFLKSYGDRLMMTHLNDNLGLRSPDGIPSGEDDLHFLPFDGAINWGEALRRLRNAPKQTTLNFEIKVTSHSRNQSDIPYAQIPLEQFISTAGERARRIAELYAKTMAEPT